MPYPHWIGEATHIDRLTGRKVRVMHHLPHDGVFVEFVDDYGFRALFSPPCAISLRHLKRLDDDRK